MFKVMFGLMILLFCISCRKEEGPAAPSPVPTSAEYFPMTKGSYWIYERWTVDTAGVSMFPFADYDSAFVAGDSIINAKIYTVIDGTLSGKICLRDSSDCLVDEYGHRKFSLHPAAGPFTEESIGPGLFTSTSVMKGDDSACVVPAGSFTARYRIGSVVSLIDGPSWRKSRAFHTAYVKGIGLVSERRMDWTYPVYIDSKLIRYHIAP